MKIEVPLAQRIEHTLLSPVATRDAIDRLCEEAMAHQFVGVCVQPIHVAHCAHLLRGTQVRVVTVVGFPLGVSCSVSKAFETQRAIADGAHEIDTVLRVDALLQGDDATVVSDIAAVVEVAEGRPVKVILETGHLSDEQITRGCLRCVEAGARYVKTSTGFGPRGASVHDIQWMRAAVGPGVGIKASGGIRTREQALALVEAGADRLGTSAGVQLVGTA